MKSEAKQRMQCWSIRNSLGGECGYVETVGDYDPLTAYAIKSGLGASLVKSLNYTARPFPEHAQINQPQTPE